MANLLLLLLLSGIVVLMAWRVRSDRERNHTLEERASAVTALQNARAEFFRGAIALTSAAVAPDARPLVKMYYNAQVQGDRELARARTALESLGATAQVAAVEKLSRHLGEVRAEVDSVLAWSLAADQFTRTSVSQQYQPLLWPQVEQMMAILDDIAGELDADLAAGRAEANSALNLTLWLLVASCFAVLVFSITTFGFATARIVRPLAALQRNARAIASGNLEARAHVSGPEEVTALADDFNHMTEALLERTEKLQISEQSFRNVLDVSRDIIYKLNHQARTYEYMSPSVLSICGFTPEELIDMGLRGTTKRVHPDDLEKYRTSPDQLPSSPAQHRDGPIIEYRWKCKNGEYRWLSDNRALIRDEKGRPLATVGTVRDITDWKKAEEALRENEQKFRSLCALAPVGIFLTDSSGNCVYLNEYLQAIGGMTAEECLGHGWTKVLHPDDRDETIMETASAAEEMGEFARELRIVDSVGRTRWVRVMTRPVISPEGRQTGRIGVVEDISERKRIDEEKQGAYETIVTLLAAAAEARDPYTEDHLSRIRGYSEAIADELGLPPDESAKIGLASLLHDIGKLRVPDSILTKPGDLTPEEWQVMKLHTVWGDELLAGHVWLEKARQIARWHHENWDGSGYPDGLSETEIPISAAIVAVADGFDAMTSDRPYKKAWPPTKAVREIQSQRGKRYSPQVVDAFMRALEKGQIEKIALRTFEEMAA
ncbi:MAG: PAS domain S-box protein [Dehalococcoidia bacterium]|nr:PAS domain S-box protein [Dehalococcoidia bacterium]